MQEMPQFGEMPEPMRQIMKSSIEQAKRAFDTFIGASQQAMSNLDTSSSPAAESLKVLNERIAEFTKNNAEANFDLAMRLADAKQLNDVIEMQHQHLRTQMETFTRQLEELRQLTTKMMQDAGSVMTPSARDIGTSYGT